ncbi:RNA pseudouridine synthase [Massilia sp. DD77]|uniref:RNA pseudouridine synthase n=1 Tax=Massilia sp. DD77 TaxID=3109349 RepID=UPI002FFD815E
MSDDAIRLAKRVAELKGCSRAEAERYIAGGWVTVDGDVTEDPATRVSPDQAVALLPGATAIEPLPVTILLHKPAGVDAAEGALALITPETLVQEGRGGQRFLRRHLHKITLATPLAREASGLVVYSQDWRVLRKLVDDSSRIEQEYVVEVEGDVAGEGLAGLNRHFKASWQNETRLRVAGKNVGAGKIEAACAGVDLQVRSIRRLRVGSIPLAGLPVGHWRYLPDTERF